MGACLPIALLALMAPADQSADAPGTLAAAKPGTISSPRELLELAGVGRGQLDRLADGTAWQKGEDEVLLKVLFRLGRFRPAEIEGWARDDLPPAELARDPSAYRGELFRLRGRVVRAEVVRLPPERAERFELNEFYRCQFVLENGAVPAVVFARTIPRAWATGEPIDERSGAFGMFLKAGSEEAGRRPIFAARRLAWYPPTRLGELGMDVGLFDDLRGGQPDDSARHRRLEELRLTKRNRECFYQMLAAVGRARPGELLEAAEQELRRTGAERFSVVPLFNEPAGQQGRLVLLSGTAREVIRIVVSDPDVVDRLGIDHYYQIALFTEDSQHNPLVFCVRELPDGMPTGGGPEFGEDITAAGFFFNTWAYRSRQPADASGPRWQLAPLLIGRQPVWHRVEKRAANPVAGAVAGGLFVLALLAVWLILWRHGREDKRLRDARLTGPSVAETEQPDPQEFENLRYDSVRYRRSRG